MAKSNWYFIFLLLQLLFFCGCTDSANSSKLEKELSILKGEIDTLKAELDSQTVYLNKALIPQLNNKFNAINKQNLDLRLFQIENKLEANSKVSFDLSDKGYTKIDTSSGFFLITIDDVKPYLDGVKVVWRIGNPLLTNFKGFKFFVKYGPRKPEFPTDTSATDSFSIWAVEISSWTTKLQTREVNFTEELLPGAWNKAVMILPKVKVEELAFLEISMFTNTLTLIDKTKK